MKLGGYTKLRLVVSQGTEMVKIPNVAWQDKNTVYYRPKDELGLVVDEVPEYHEEIASGMAIRTDPESGDDVKKGSRVTLYWSLGPKRTGNSTEFSRGNHEAAKENWPMPSSRSVIPSLQTVKDIRAL